MNPLDVPHSSAACTVSEFATPTGTDNRVAGIVLIVDALLSFAPVGVLGAAIGWPASLGKPAAEQLAAIHAHAGAVALGYGLYLLYSLLVAPAMIGFAARVFGGLGRGLPAAVAAFATMSALARAIGILRWFTVMPALAAAHAVAGPASRENIEMLFAAVTTYGGGIGEVLGVSLAMAFSVGGLCAGAWLRGGMPRALAATGLAVAAALGALTAPAFGLPAVISVAPAVTALSMWMLAAGVWCLRSATEGGAQ